MADQNTWIWTIQSARILRILAEVSRPNRPPPNLCCAPLERGGHCAPLVTQRGRCAASPRCGRDAGGSSSRRLPPGAGSPRRRGLRRYNGHGVGRGRSGGGGGGRARGQGDRGEGAEGPVNVRPTDRWTSNFTAHGTLQPQGTVQQPLIHSMGIGYWFTREQPDVSPFRQHGAGYESVTQWLMFSERNSWSVRQKPNH